MDKIIQKKMEETAALKELYEIAGKETVTEYSEDGRPIAGRYPLPTFDSPIDSITSNPFAVTVFWKNGGNTTVRPRANVKSSLVEEIKQAILIRYQYNIGWLVRHT